MLFRSSSKPGKAGSVARGQLQAPRQTQASKKNRLDKQNSLKSKGSLIVSFSVNRERTACQYLSPGPIGTDRKDHKHKRDREESDRPQRIPGSHTCGGGPKMTP